MKKLFTMILCAVLTISMVACGTSQKAEKENVQIPSPFQEVKTLEEASKIAGFDIIVPDKIDGYSKIVIEAVEKEMIQVFYIEGEKTLLIRKSNQAGDPSGDYNAYQVVEEVEQNGINIPIKGDGETASLAVWSNNGYSYSISCDKMAQNDLLALVNSVQ